MNSNHSRLDALSARMDAVRPASVWKRARYWFHQQMANKRTARYTLVGINVLLLVAIAWFTLGPTHRGQPLGQQGVIAADGDAATEPLDVLSSADIATNAALA